MIPISVISFDEEAERLVLEVLRSGKIAQGRLVEEFETRFAALIGVDHAVAVNNGTTSLVASLELADLQPGDEVITSPFTFVATLNAIVEAGATAVFADIGLDDFNVHPAEVEAAITAHTRAIMPVHLYGQMADMISIERIADARSLPIIEDAAQAHGATIGGRSAGTFGTGSFSFYATKNMTTGEGGMITTNDGEAADRLRLLRNQGMRKRYHYEVAGHNYRLTDLQAALVIPQLKRYDDQVAIRQSNAAYLSDGLQGAPGVATPEQLPDRRHVWHQYTIRITDASSVTRDEVVRSLESSGIGCGVYYPRVVFDYDAYRDHPAIRVGEFPKARAAAASVLSLPVHDSLSRDDLDRIVEVVRDAVRA